MDGGGGGRAGLRPQKYRRHTVEPRVSDLRGNDGELVLDGVGDGAEVVKGRRKDLGGAGGES